MIACLLATSPAFAAVGWLLCLLSVLPHPARADNFSQPISIFRSVSYAELIVSQS